MVPRDKQALPQAVPDGEREDAVEPFNAFGAAFLVGVQDDLRVGSGPELVPFLFQGFPELDIVVYLAVEDQMERAVLIGHGLAPAADVDDA